MKLAVDIGGTKVLVALFNDSDEIEKQYKFETPKNYDNFLDEFKKQLVNLNDYSFDIAAVAIPEMIDRKSMFLIDGGNLKWRQKNIIKDLSDILNCQVLLENDANLAGLSEAINVKNQFQRVMYLTISTGIGGALVINQGISEHNLNLEPGLMKLMHNDQLTRWEHFASGRAIVEQYHQFAKEIYDDQIWQAVSDNIVQGLVVLVPLFQPEVIVFGGSVGSYFDRYQKFLLAGLQAGIESFVPLPALKQALHPEEAVVYGCLELIKQYQANF